MRALCVPILKFNTSYLIDIEFVVRALCVPILKFDENPILAPDKNENPLSTI